MQETQEKLSLNVSSVDGVVSQNPVLPRGLVAPYRQQAHDINKMLQNQMTIELHCQLRSLEQRAVFCMNIKDKVIAEMNKRYVEMENRMKKASAEAEFWKNMSAQKTDLCKDLAGRLLKVRKRDMAMKMNVQMNSADEAESSTGDNGDDAVDTARTRVCKRLRL